MPGNLSLFSAFSYNRVFVETGTCGGISVEIALAAGYSDIRTVELSRPHYEYCVGIFANRPQVALWHGRSQEELAKMIADVNEPITFWLDAHRTGGDTASDGYDQQDIILAELRIIAAHPISEHTILIDDQGDGWNETIVSQLMEINPMYAIDRVDSWWDGRDNFYPKSVLVAEPPNRKRKHEITKAATV